jgi:hypothetical protein
MRHLFAAQETLLKVNAEYIRSAAQSDAFRTEPPFKLQGSYRNMNKIAEKIVSAMTATELEALVDDLESKWRNDVSDPVTRPKSEKTNRTAGSFKGGKGYEYVFRGTAHGVPWVEKGWVVKDAGALWVIRTQFGGKTAETALGPETNALVKSMALDK